MGLKNKLNNKTMDRWLLPVKLVELTQLNSDSNNG